MQDTRNARTTRTHPLAATLERVSSAKDGEVRPSARVAVPDEPGWTTVEDLAGCPDLLREVMARLGRTYGLDDLPFAGTTLLRDCLWRTLSSAVAVFLTEGRLPDLSAGNVALRFGEDGFAEGLAFVEPRFFVLPDDPDAGHPDAVVVPSEDALLGEMRAALVETHLPALIPALRDLRVRRGTRTLQMAVSDVVAEAFMFVGRELGREAEGCAFAETLLSVPSPISAPANFSTLEYPGGSERTRVRRTCCLYYKAGNGCCFTCPRKTDEERIRDLMEQAGEGEA